MDTAERNRKDEVEDAPPSNAGLLRSRLELVGHYALLGLAPALSAVALIFALLAYTGNQTNRSLLSETNARIDSISTSHSETKDEPDIFQVSLAREKALLAEERKKQVEKDAKIISSVTQLQFKLKVAPTLDEQLKVDAKVPEIATPVASTPVAAAPATGAAPVPAPVPTPAAVPTPAMVEKAQPVQPTAKPAVAAKVPAPAKVEKALPVKPTAKPAAAAKAPAPAKDSGKKPAAAASTTGKATKADALKKTLEEFNKIDRSK